MKAVILSVVLWASINPIVGHAENPLTTFSELKNSGLLVVNSQGQPVIAKYENKPFIPASTTKLVTAWLALNHWGEQHRFQTDFFLNTISNTLWIKGSGDPYLVSEELELVAKNLKQLGLTKINAIGLDASMFQPNLMLPGTGISNNPYDAVPSAVAANFNTVNIKKVNGKVVTAEIQTPLTDYAKSLVKQLEKGPTRINTGPDPRNAEKYFAELLAAFLRKQGVKVGQKIISGRVPVQRVYYTHTNSRTLAEMIRPMMKYSTNFLANQLILKLSAETYHRPANAADVQRYIEKRLADHFQWTNFTMKDGAGLARTNRLSPTQLVDLLNAFRKWKHLLPEIEPGIYAKSGTLNQVSTLAGYIVVKNSWEPFALMMNQAVPYKFRNRIARELAIRKNRNSVPLEKTSPYFIRLDL